MRDVGHDAHGALILERLRTQAQGAGGIDHIVDEYAALAAPLTDYVHDLGLIGPRPALVDNRQLRIVELFGKGSSARDAADVGRDHDQIRILLAPDFPEQY